MLAEKSNAVDSGHQRQKGDNRQGYPRRKMVGDSEASPERVYEPCGRIQQKNRLKRGGKIFQAIENGGKPDQEGKKSFKAVTNVGVKKRIKRKKAGKGENEEE